MVYNSDHDYHMGLRTEVDKTKTGAKRKGAGAGALRAAHTPADVEAAPAERPETPLRGHKTDVWVEIPMSASVGRGDRAVSPVSTSSSASEPPLAQRMRMNGAAAAAATATVASDAASPALALSVSAAATGDGAMSPGAGAEVSAELVCAGALRVDADGSA